MISAIWGTLRLVVFKSIVFPLTYAIPLLLCVWTRDKGMLWAMAGTYVLLQTIKQFWVLPAAALPSWADWATYGATVFNILVAGLAVHAIIVLRQRLDASLEEVAAQADQLARQNEELTEQSEELAAQNEELSQQSAELSQQTEEASQQAEELSRQNEELHARSEEIQELSTELGHRERLLQRLLDVVRVAGSDEAAVQHVCRAASAMLGPPVGAVVLYEVVDETLRVRGSDGLDQAALAGASRPDLKFPWLVISENRAACLNDAALRRDLGVLEVSDRAFGAFLGAPLQEDGRSFGALVAFATQPHEWTTQQFRVVEWLAGRAGQVLHGLRLRRQLVRQAAIIDLTPDAIIGRRADGIVTLWGHGAELLYGWTKAEAVGQDVHKLLRTRGPQALEEVLDQVSANGQWTGELVHTTKDGRERLVESRWLGTRDESGTLVEVLESNVDITERKRTERALQDADRRKSDFLATLSHELRNPLAPIRFALQLIDGNGSDPHARAKLVIERQLGHLVRLVDDLLDLTRIASNKVRLQTSRVQVSAVLEQALEACKPEAEVAGHVLTVSHPPSPAWIEADCDRLAQVLINLIGNSIRYTPRGGHITVSCTAAEDAVTISVRDDGIGLRREDLSRVFEMFEQVGEPGHGGLGIGLSLVKELVELHGGTVNASSDGIGQGSEFRVCLPRAAAPAAIAARIASSPDAAGAATPRRILVVDDNVDAAEMMQMLLELEGHDVSVAHDGHSALERLGERRFDLALFDIGLPGMSGYELARLARTIPGNETLRMVAVTGWGQESDREQARASGFHGHVTKPADPDRLRALIAECGPAAPHPPDAASARERLSTS